MFRIALMALIGWASPALAIEKCVGSNRYTCIVDGDTFWLNGEKWRTFGYDTPEPMVNICGGNAEVALANRATRRFIELWNTRKITIKRIGGVDRYGRSLGVVMADGLNIGDILVAEGLARRYPDGCEFWCRSCK